LVTKFTAYLCVTRLLDRTLNEEKVDELVVRSLCIFVETIGRKFHDDRSEAKDKNKIVPAGALQVTLELLKSLVATNRLAHLPDYVTVEVARVVSALEVLIFDCLYFIRLPRRF